MNGCIEAVLTMLEAVQFMVEPHNPSIVSIEAS
jgi:hypothetical protein